MSSLAGFITPTMQKREELLLPSIKLLQRMAFNPGEPTPRRATRVLASVVSAEAARHHAIRWWGNDESYLTARGSSRDDLLPTLRLHQFHRPGDGTSGEG